MKIQMTADLIGDDYNLKAGEITEKLDDATATRLIQGGYAVGVPDAPAPVVKDPNSREEVEGELTALGVYFIRGADLDSLIGLRNRSKAPAKPDPLDHDGDGKRGGSRKPAAA